MIGYVDELPGVTPTIMYGHIGKTRAHGRSWDEIGNRLDMTGDEAEAAFEKLGSAYWVKPAPRRQKHLAGLMHAIADPLNDAADDLARDRIRW